MFESLEGEQLQPYMDAIELEGNAAQPMDEGDGEEKVSQHRWACVIISLSGQVHS